ncbi:MAG: aspartate kinase [Planctomycetia bacterium]|jgi:aspartate kinase
MSILVQKFGGTSVADSNKILTAARKAIRAHQEGYQVLVVVSAMGKNTDMLVNLAKELHEHPPAREMDMLLSTGEQVSVALMAMAIDSLGHKAVSLTGIQMGIVTDSAHTKARIRSICTDRILEAFNSGNIVIAAGFQGVDDAMNITTLGRGGSDTTAVALAAALGADICEINTDVDGVYTTDPRILPEARRAGKISYDEMLELASAGAGVMHNRAIEFAKRFNVPVHVRSSFTDTDGTMITNSPESPSQPVCGAAVVKNEAQVSIANVPDRPGAALTIFSKVAARNIAMDMIVQNIGTDGLANISFTVFREDLPATLTAVEQAIEELGSGLLSYDDSVSVVSIVGLGMATQPGVADRMFRALADANVNIQMITTSLIKISVLVSRKEANRAIQAVHESFSLETLPSDAGDIVDFQPNQDQTTDVDAVMRIQGMEGLLIDEITLDKTASRITIHDIPDTPGLAAEIFEKISADGVIVDMIVQSHSVENRAALSFTVPTEMLDRAIEIVTQTAEAHDWSMPTSCAEIAKLSVTGIGMRSHTEVADQMFNTLAEQGINVDMISTSEVCVDVAVDITQGERGLEALHKTFANVMV